MRIRSELNMPWVQVGEGVGRPPVIDTPEPGPDSGNGLNPDLYSPEDADLRAAVRDHIMEHPEGILIDAYQAATELELKYPSGSPEARERYLKGLRGEVLELHEELMLAHAEHPYVDFAQETEDATETWLIALLDQSRLRHIHLSPERREHVLGELGDVLWYSSRVASEVGVTLSDCFMRFLHSSHARTALEKWYGHGWQEEIEAHVGDILTFETIQEVALSQKGLDTQVVNEGTPMRQRATIDNKPHEIIGRVHGNELFRVDGMPDPLPERPYADLPHIEVTIGKLIWFVAYTSHTLLNEELSTVARANLEKVTNRAQRGTLFSKRLRDDQDESGIKAGQHRRMPMHG